MAKKATQPTEEERRRVMAYLGERGGKQRARKQSKAALSAQGKKAARARWDKERAKRRQK